MSHASGTIRVMGVRRLDCSAASVVVRCPCGWRDVFITRAAAESALAAHERCHAGDRRTLAASRRRLERA